MSAAVPKAKGEDGEFCSDDESSGDEENKTVSLNMSLNTVSLLLSCSTTIYNSLCFIEFATYILRVIRKQSLCYYKGKVRLVLTTLKNILGDSQLLA